MNDKMNDKIIKILKKFALIEPDGSFRERSRTEILLTPRSENSFKKVSAGVFESMRLGTTLVLASVLLLILVGGFSYFKLNSAASIASSSFDFETLNREAQKIDLQIKLNEIDYFDDSVQDVAAVLDDLSDEKGSPDVDELLDELVL